MTKAQGRGGESLNHDQGGADQAMLTQDAARYRVMLTAQWHTDAEAQGEEHAETGLHL